MKDISGNAIRILKKTPTCVTYFLSISRQHIQFLCDYQSKHNEKAHPNADWILLRSLAWMMHLPFHKPAHLDKLTFQPLASEAALYFIWSKWHTLQWSRKLIIQILLKKILPDLLSHLEHY